MGQQSIVAYNRRNESEPVVFDKHFAPTCFREHTYRYDSYDSKYETLKYTHPKECSDCPLAQEGICQKVFKMKVTKDLVNTQRQLAVQKLGKAYSKGVQLLKV